MSYRRGGGISPLLARLLIFLACIAVSRVVLKVVVVGMVNSMWPTAQIDEAAALLDLPMPYQQVTGDGPRRGDMHEDLQRSGQVVTRNGELVVLLDDSDPDNEVYVPLDSKDGGFVLNPLLTVDPMLFSVGMGSFLFIGFMIVGWRLNQDRDSVAATTPETTNNPPTTPPTDGTSW